MKIDGQVICLSCFGSLYKLGEVAVENGQIASHSTVELLDMMLVWLVS